MGLPLSHSGTLELDLTELGLGVLSSDLVAMGTLGSGPPSGAFLASVPSITLPGAFGTLDGIYIGLASADGMSVPMLSTSPVTH